MFLVWLYIPSFNSVYKCLIFFINIRFETIIIIEIIRRTDFIMIIIYIFNTNLFARSIGNKLTIHISHPLNMIVNLFEANLKGYTKYQKHK